MVQFTRSPLEHPSSGMSTVPLLETPRSDLVMLYESKLRWAGIEYNTEFLDDGSRIPRATERAQLRVSVPRDRLEEARRLLDVLEDEVL